MPPDLTAVIERVRRLRASTHEVEPSLALIARIDDGLSQGYAWALDGDAWSMREEQRLHELISDNTTRPDGGELHARATEHERFQRDLAALRHELAELWRERQRLCSSVSPGRAARSA